MTRTQAVLTTPSRLHFGLLRFAQPKGRSYGGVGLMIKAPRVVVRVATSPDWQVAGPQAERASSVARRVVASIPELNGERFSLYIEALPPLHSGLGVGTQLALAIAQGMMAACGLAAPRGSAKPQAAQAALAAGRARRSAVGSHGFIHGGLIYEAGFLPGEQVGELVARTPLPEAWRVVLLRIATTAGISGTAETEAFARLPPPPASVSEQLERLAADEIIPGAQARDFGRFSEAVYQYGTLAGRCFESVQGGPFATPEIATAVGRLRELGSRGVGQSSWGPTIYAFCETEADARQLVDRCQSDPLLSRAEHQVTEADNQGAQITRVST